MLTLAVRRACLLSLVVLCALSQAAADDEGTVDKGDQPKTEAPKLDLAALKMRVRVKSVTPNGPVSIRYRHTGEGLGGEAVSGTIADRVEPGEWSEGLPISQVSKARYHFLTVTLGAPIDRTKKKQDKAPALTAAEFEFEFSYQDKVIKTFSESSPNGATVGVFIPLHRLVGTVQPASPEFLNELGGLLGVATRRAEALEALPWAKWPVPQKYLIITDLGGYGEHVGYGVRHSDKKIVEMEVRALRQLGHTGLRAAPSFLKEMIAERRDLGKDLARGCEEHGVGYPNPGEVQGKPGADAGCPFAPGVAERQKAGLARFDEFFKKNLPEVFALTVDEIGPMINGAADGKKHINTCPHCQQGFRDYVKLQGVSPQELGKKDWSEVVPNYGEAADTPEAKLTAYYSGRFVNWSSARMFTPQRDFLAAANEEKRKSLAGGDTSSPAAKRPYVYSFALRGNNFLMGGSSLDFFDFYRHADNAFVYETSNRDSRIWSWDAYLCDVGRIVSDRQKIVFGIYIKPHRGAVLQRMLAAVSRNCRMIFWYTYGPDYHKGDCFSEKSWALAATSKAAHLLGKTEHVVYDSTWTQPAEVAVVRPWWSANGPAACSNAIWEEGKWTYTALQHGHIPVDPLDETLLVSEDLARYKAIYVTGRSLPKAAAEKLAKWVEAGGVLYTSAAGLQWDEAGQPLSALAPVLGLQTRGEPELWYSVARYGATQIDPFDEKKKVLAEVPPGAAIESAPAPLKPLIGREVLKAGEGTEVVAKFADGSPALTRHKHGKGAAYVAGFFPGLEYSAAVRMSDQDYDMARSFDARWRDFVLLPVKGAVRPVVDSDVPTVEGVLLKNNVSGKQCVTVANWGYRLTRPKEAGAKPVNALSTLENVKLTIRGAGAVAKVVSAMLESELPLHKADDAITVTLPKLEEGDILLLE